MVEAIRVIFPFSINSSRVCCCFLLKYWISSKYSKIPFGAVKVFSASVKISRRSAVPAVVPLSFRKARLVCLAMIDAKVVLPTPDGP